MSCPDRPPTSKSLANSGPLAAQRARICVLESAAMFEPVSPSVSFPELDRATLAFWDKEGVFEKSIAFRKGRPRFTFYEGPPTANGMPHPGHVLTRVMKDVFLRYRSACGYEVPRIAGWDTHGLPV